MDLAERIARRRSQRTGDRLVVDWDALNPAIHLPEPIGREALFEALFDAIDPVFDETLPGNVYVWGPPGAGKSAIVTSLVPTLREVLSRRQPVYTATRGGSEQSGIRFVYVDARQATSRFQLYRQTLDALRTGSVPERGVGTDELRDRLRTTLGTCEGVLVAVDHVGEPGTVAVDDLYEFFGELEQIAWIGVGQTPPGELPIPIPKTTVHVPPYSYELVDILTIRATRGLSRNLDHEHARRIAEWADGNAHDALGALFVAAVNATEDGRSHIRTRDVEYGIEDVPRNGVPVGRVVALTDNEQRVLTELLELTNDGSRTIDSVAADIATRSDLTTSTVTRLLYELAQKEILKRVQTSTGDGIAGRKPSMVSRNFSGTLFERLTES